MWVSGKCMSYRILEHETYSTALSTTLVKKNVSKSRTHNKQQIEFGEQIWTFSTSIGQITFTPRKFNSSPRKRGFPKRKGSSSNHHFLGATLNFWGVTKPKKMVNVFLVILGHFFPWIIVVDHDERFSFPQKKTPVFVTHIKVQNPCFTIDY